MAAATDLVLTTTNRLRSIQATLKNPDGSVIDLTATTAVVFRMVLASDPTSVKVNNAAAVIVSPPTAGIVRYDLAAADCDTVASYFAWFIRTEGGLTETFPYGGRNPGFKIQFVAAT